MPMPQPPLNSPVQTEPTITGKVTIKTVWQNWFQLAQIYLANLTGSGPTSARPTENLWLGMPFFDSTLNVPVYWDGKTWVTSAPAGTVTSVTGTAPIASSGGTTPNITISQANTTTDGYLSHVDWNTFNNKQPAGSYVTGVGGSAPIVSSGGTTPTISIPAANSTTNGYLTSTDWNTFNSAANNQTYINVAAVYGAMTSAAIQSAVTAYPNRTLYLKAGTWAISSGISISSPISIVGDGTDSTILSVSINSDVFTITAGGGCIFRDFSIGSTSSQLTGGSIFVLNGGSGNQRTLFDHISFYNIYYGIKFTTSNIWIIRSCYFVIYNTAISVSNSNNDAGDSTITECIFNANSITQGTAIFQDSSGGLRIINNKFLNGLYHYLGQYNTPTHNTSILVFVGNSSEGAKTANLAFNTGSYPFQGVNITGNQFSIGGSFGGSSFTTAYGIEFIGANSISDVMIGSNEFNGNATGQVLYFGGAGTNITVGTNTFNGIGGTGSGAAIGIGSSNPSIYFMPQSFLGYSPTYQGIGSNQTFAMGQAQSGSSSYMFFTVAYGSFAGNTLWCTGDKPISFNTSFPQTPAVTAYIVDSASSGYGFQIKNVTASGFTINVLGWTYNNPVVINWNAWLTGQ